MLQSEAGYIDARPPPPIRRNLLATRGRTIHWVKRYRIGLSGHVRSSPDSDRIADIPAASCHFQPQATLPPARAVVYERICDRNVPIVPRSELAAWMVAAVSSKNRDRTLDRRKRGQAFRPGHGMANPFTTARSTVAMRRRGAPAIVMLAAMAALTALTTDAAARTARPAPPTEATAPRDAGEPIMAIVSIKSQQLTFYDADGATLRRPGP